MSPPDPPGNEGPDPPGKPKPAGVQAAGSKKDNSGSAQGESKSEEPGTQEQKPLPHCGLWICPHLEEHSGLSWDEKVLVAKIDSIVVYFGNPCFANNTTLATWQGVSQTRIDHMLARLQKEEVILRRFYGKYVLRIITPGYSANPKLSEKWKQSWAKSKVSLVKNDNPSLVKNDNPDFSLVKNDSLALSKTTVQGCQKRQTESSNEFTQLETSSSHELSTPGCSVTVSGNDDVYFGSNGKNGTEEEAASPHDTPEEENPLVTLLTEVDGFTEARAIQLAVEFSPVTIQKAVLAYQFELSRKTKIKCPAGWVHERITKGYPDTKEFKEWCVQLQKGGYA